MSRYEDCEVCGERYHDEYIPRYLTSVCLRDEWFMVCQDGCVHLLLKEKGDLTKDSDTPSLFKAKGEA